MSIYINPRKSLFLIQNSIYTKYDNMSKAGQKKEEEKMKKTDYSKTIINSTSELIFYVKKKTTLGYCLLIL